MNDPLQDFRARLPLAIRAVAPQGGTEVAKDLEYIMEGYFEWLAGCIYSGEMPTRLLDMVQLTDALEIRISTALNGKNGDHAQEYATYVGKIISLLGIDMITDEKVPGVVKAISAMQGLNFIEDNKLFLEGDIEVAMTAETYRSHLMRLIESDDPVRTLDDLIAIKRKEIEAEPYLFELALIEKLDHGLRGEFIDKNSEFLSTALHRDRWPANKPTVKWTGGRNLLFYLLTKLNMGKREIEHGTLLHLIAKSFTIKGKAVTAYQLSKSYFKFSVMPPAKINGSELIRDIIFKHRGTKI